MVPRQPKSREGPPLLPSWHRIRWVHSHRSTTFVQDFLDVNALCAGSIAAITTGASAIAAYSGALHAACRYNGLLKQPTPGGAKGFLGDRVMWVLKSGNDPTHGFGISWLKHFTSIMNTLVKPSSSSKPTHRRCPEHRLQRSTDPTGDVTRDET